MFFFDKPVPFQLSSLLPTSPNHQRRGSSSSEKGFFSSFTNHSSSSGIGGSNSQATTPTSAGPGLLLGTPQTPQLNIITGRPAWVERELATRIRVPHTFLVHSYKKPTLCQHCKKLLKGFFRQGKQCKDCEYSWSPFEDSPLGNAGTRRTTKFANLSCFLFSSVQANTMCTRSARRKCR